MANIKKLFWRKRFFLEVLCLLCLLVFGEFAVTLALDAWAPAVSRVHAALLNAISLTLLLAPFVGWRSRAVHSRDAYNLAQAMRHSDIAVVRLDTGGRIYWINSGFTQMSGYTLEEAIGHTPAQLLDSGQTDADTLETLKLSRVGRTACRAVVCNRHKDASLHYVDIDFRPDYDAQGKLAGFIEICTDITALKQAQISLEASLRESEALRHTVDTHAIVSVSDHTGRIIDANPAFCAISGYSRAQLLGQDHRALNSGTHAPEFWAVMWENISHGKPWRGEICNRNRNGKLYWVDSMIAPFMGADGLVEKYVSVRTDITERKATEVALARQTQLLTEVVYAAPSGMAVYDEQHVLRLHNPQFAEILGLPALLLEQQGFQFADQVRYQYARGDYGSAQGVDAVLATFERAMESRQFLNLERRQFDGRHIALNAYPISNGWTVLNYRDNTERKIQQRHLSDAQERVRLATESAGIGIWSLHAVTGEQAWDAQQYRLFGLAPEAHAGSSSYDRWASHLHPEDAESSREAFQHCINNGVPFDHVFRIIRPDGEVRHIKALGSPRLGAEGRVEYIVGTNMDVTDATLLAQSMRDATMRAEQASRVKSEFLANMSHELRTPMNAVMGMLMLLERSALDALQRQHLDAAASASRMMLHLMDDLLDYAKMSSDTCMLSPESFSLGDVLQELSDTVGLSLKEKEIEVLFEVDPRLPETLFGDPQRLQQILLNLVGNAIKFTPAGTVVCSMRLEAPQGASRRVVFCVRDTGIGIAPEFREAIFRSFTQVQSSTTRAFGGIGLGLTISQRLVGLMGGSIVLESELGVGSSFSFAIDLLPADSEGTPPRTTQASFVLARAGTRVQGAALQPPPVRAQRLQGLRVLAVDDVQINQAVLEKLLTSEGALVALVDNGRQAVDAVVAAHADQAFDVVLMDLQMPVMDGYEAARLIRSMPGMALLPIVALTANVHASDRARCLEVGMNRHVSKPYVLDELVAVIGSVTGLPMGVQATAAAIAPWPQAPVAAPDPMHAYWICSSARQALPDATALLQQGVVLQVLESMDALASLLQAGAPAGLLVLESEQAIGAAMRAPGGSGQGASMAAMPMIAVADAPTEVHMRACLRAGAIDMVPTPFALHHLGLLGTRWLNAQGAPRADFKTEVAAIASQRAIQQLQSDLPFFASLLRVFYDELPARQRQLQSDWQLSAQQIENYCHALKGLAMTLGLHQLSDVARCVEDHAAQAPALDARWLVQIEAELQSAGFQVLRWLQLYAELPELTQ